MKIKNYNVKIVPTNGAPYHAVASGFTRTDAYVNACTQFPGASCIVLNEI